MRHGKGKQTGELEVSDEKLWLVLHRAHNAVNECLQNGIATRGIAVSDFIVLEALLHGGALTASEISLKTRLAASSVKMTLRRLKQQEQIQEQPWKADPHRKAVWELTAQGRTSIEWLFGEHLGDIKATFHGLTASQRHNLYQSLRKVGKNAESRRDAPAANSDGVLTPWQLRRVTQFMRRHLAHPISTTEVAASIELSDSHFRRAFKNATGLTPHQWLLGTRIAEAQKLLKEGVVPISEIASLTGFGDQSHFSRTYKKVFGLSPRAWQRDDHLR
jgi:AraC-like DNA-binding protein/DNA-binding MarR family transcriptional regulator